MKMARQVCHVVLIVVLLTSAYVGASGPDWVDELNESLHIMNHNIQAQVQRFTQDLHSQIENSLRPALAEVNRAIANIPKDAQGRILTNGHIISNGGNILSVSSGNGVSRTVMSGHTTDGEPYVRNIEERNDGTYLYHNESSYNPRTNITERIRWKLNLTTPGAVPELLTDEI